MPFLHSLYICSPSSVAYRRGISLFEMAIVLAVIGLIIITTIPGINAAQMATQRSATRSNLQALMLATAAYVQANGCLPCPTPASVTGTGFGRVRGDTSTAPQACGTCATPEGVVPYMSMGIAATTARDGWGRWITMRVDPGLTGSGTNFTVIAPPSKFCSCTQSGSTCTASSSACSCTLTNNACVASPANISQQGMCTASLSKSTIAQPISVQTYAGSSQTAAIVFVSHGSNGFGSYYAGTLGNGCNGSRLLFPSVPTLGCPLQTLNCNVITSSLGDAECNASGLAQFVDAPAQLNGSSTYDDMLAYADRNSLVSMLGNGSCQTVW